GGARASAFLVQPLLRFAEAPGPSPPHFDPLCPTSTALVRGKLPNSSHPSAFFRAAAKNRPFACAGAGVRYNKEWMTSRGGNKRWLSPLSILIRNISTGLRIRRRTFSNPEKA